MFSESVVLDLVGRIYEAAEDPAVWPSFLSRIAQVLDTNVASLDFYDFGNQRGGVAAVIGIDARDVTAYVEHYGNCNSLWPRMEAEGLNTTGTVVDNRMVFDDAEFARTEYAADYLEKRLGLFHAAGGTILRNDRVSSNLSVLRRRSKPFEEDERKLLRVLMPHLQRSLSLHRRLTQAGMAAALAAEAIDRLSTAAIVVNERGEVVLMNRAAAAIARQRDGLSVSRNSLQASTASETRGIAELLAHVSGGVTTIGRPSGKRAYILTVTPLRSSPGRAAAILITDPAAATSVDADLLKRIHGLTRTESRVAAMLVAGNSVKEVATILGISVSTARQHLKSIFLKTDTTRQSELVLLLSRTVV